MPPLFSPLTLRSVTLRNRIGVSPMCMYSSIDGSAQDWHLVHLGSFARGGAGLVIAEATAVQAIGRITPGCAGLWQDAQIEPSRRVVSFIHQMGGAAAVQLAHAGRKASCPRPWDQGPRGTLSPQRGGWQPVSASPIAFSEAYAAPRELTRQDIAQLVQDFASAARRARDAGYDIVEVHAAHGYLLHSFHSPLSNQRSDDYGGSFENRTRATREVVRAIRAVWPDAKPLFVRLSCTDYVEGGWTLDESVALARILKAEGVDLIDCSSGGAAPGVNYPMEGMYQAPFAGRIRREAGIATAAVGNITDAHGANALIADGVADIALLARAMLRDPHWPVHAAEKLGAPTALRYPPQYDAFIGPKG
jgi:2,4-dienoyl-CoA reductase-like NADH-dependent reductase (Old Yellow Enzyme family)